MRGDRLVRYAVGRLRQWTNTPLEHAPDSPTEHRAKRAADELGFDEPTLRGGHAPSSSLVDDALRIAQIEAADRCRSGQPVEER